MGGEKLLTLLQEGKTIALVSDAGLPCISDPGADIVEKQLLKTFLSYQCQGLMQQFQR